MRALARIAAALGGELSPSQRAADFFGACAGGGAAALRAALNDAPTLAALRALGGGEKGSTVQLRALATFAEAAAAGEAQLKLLDGLGLLEPLAPLCRDEDDPLSALNALELVAVVARGAGGLSWLDGKGIPAELAASLDVDVDADPMAALRRPATLQCLANILDRGGLGADALLTSERLVDRAWPLLAAPPEVRGAALALLHGAAASAGGARAVLLGDADDAVADAGRWRASSRSACCCARRTRASASRPRRRRPPLRDRRRRRRRRRRPRLPRRRRRQARLRERGAGVGRLRRGGQGAAAPRRRRGGAGGHDGGRRARRPGGVGRRRRAPRRPPSAEGARRAPLGAAGLAASEGVLELLLAAPRHPSTPTSSASATPSPN